MDEYVIEFFQWSDWFDYMVTKQLSHIRSNWELTWDHNNKQYVPESDSLAEMINNFIIELSKVSPPKKYHDNEDRLAEYCKSNLGWNIEKKDNRWVGDSYSVILEQGAFTGVNQKELLFAISGRVKAALDRSQKHFDDMEDFHQRMLADIIAILLYHRDMYN
ncbi:MAG: hypothetical protein COA45_06900 [Zetaproteobacteria bacterium]|nr:MAG: hypothetical protein COA45_06900 [Zetaproteobacteria bacterium]